MSAPGLGKRKPRIRRSWDLASANARRLDLLPYLTVAEQVQAVADADGISRALDLLMPSESLKRIGGPGWPE